MSKTVKLSDQDYNELSRIKRGLEAAQNRSITLGDSVGFLLRFSTEVIKVIGGVGDVSDKNRT